MNLEFLKKEKIPTLNEPLLIVGLPGIANVGKIAVDFIVEELKAPCCYELYSYAFPHAVYVNENNLIESPSIRLHYYQQKNNKNKQKKQDILFLCGDVQPIHEEACYEFTAKILDVFCEMKGKEILTLGGIGLQDLPKKPKVYCTGNTQALVDRFVSQTKVSTELFGVVGPILGVSGVMLGLSQRRNIPACTLLAETLAHPLYTGMSGAKEIVAVLNTKLALGLDLKKLEKEIRAIDRALLKTATELSEVGGQTPQGKQQPLSYIG